MLVQARPQPDPKYVLGRGKLDDVILRAMQLDAEVLIFDRELTPGAGARRSPRRPTSRSSIARSSSSTSSRSARRAGDGKLQVELAQLQVPLPRLGEKDDSLLAPHRRHRRARSRRDEARDRPPPRARAHQPPRERSSSSSRRSASSAAQRRDAARACPIVVDRRLHERRQEHAAQHAHGHRGARRGQALRDARSRSRRLPARPRGVVTDTVGFIRDLPQELFAAFRATFEELRDADLFLHVVDASGEEDLRTTDARVLDGDRPVAAPDCWCSTRAIACRRAKVRASPTSTAPCPSRRARRRRRRCRRPRSWPPSDRRRCAAASTCRNRTGRRRRPAHRRRRRS